MNGHITYCVQWTPCEGVFLVSFTNYDEDMEEQRGELMFLKPPREGTEEPGASPGEGTEAPLLFPPGNAALGNATGHPGPAAAPERGHLSRVRVRI